MRTCLILLALLAPATATIQTTYLYPQGRTSPTGHIKWYQTDQGTTNGFYNWFDDSITVGYAEDASDLVSPRSIGTCIFRVDPFECPNGIPTCSLIYCQRWHTQAGEGESLLVSSWWNANIAWPPTLYLHRFTAFWEEWGSTDTVAVDVIHASDGSYRVPLTVEACGQIADSAAVSDPPDYKFFWTGWVYHGLVDSAFVGVWGYNDDGGRYPYIKVVYDDGQ